MSEEISFWDGVKKENNDQSLSPEEQLEFCRSLAAKLKGSRELAKIFFNTQVYNKIENQVTTRGAHSEGVAVVASALAQQKAKYDGKSKIEVKVAGFLASCLGYMHDLGHTPFGHDGEGALNSEMERFDAETGDYKAKRKAIFGEEYTKQAKDDEATEMCYEHNETSAVIGSRIVQEFAKEKGYKIDDKALQYIKTGILAHSTSRVEEEPKGMEQKAVRLADKVAYIPQDLLDLLKQSVISIDDLSPEEQGLLGLDETHDEPNSKNKIELKEKLRNLGSLSEDERIELFETLDEKVKDMQAVIAKKCFVKDEKGEMILDGRKNIVDVIDKFVNKDEKPKGRELTEKEKEAAELFRQMRAAQRHKVYVGMKFDEKKEKEVPDERDTLQPEQYKQAIDEASSKYCEFLKKEFGIDETIATLWVTKAKYQDAFINGELKRETVDEKGKAKSETLGDINKRNDNGWKMKTTFQYFYSNMDQIPKDIRDNYEGIYTEQQIVSAFIASFTNGGLDDLYQGLLDKHLVISREDAIKQLQVKRPDLDIATIVEEDDKWPNPAKPTKDIKVPANDILETLYEENVGRTIVTGKNRTPERAIPPIKHKTTILKRVEAKSSKSKEIEADETLLTSAIDISKTEVTSKDIITMVNEIRLKQQNKEIASRTGEEGMQTIDQLSENKQTGEADEGR